jgi:hypothetical protein
VLIVRALELLGAWSALLGLLSAWGGYCRRHPEVSARFSPPEVTWVAEEAEEWLRSKQRSNRA